VTKRTFPVISCEELRVASGSRELLR
jgi:hypothetical protein